MPALAGRLLQDRQGVHDRHVNSFTLNVGRQAQEAGKSQPASTESVTAFPNTTTSFLQRMPADLALLSEAVAVVGFVRAWAEHQASPT